MAEVNYGGVQVVPQIAAVQYVYLDFDGELTDYNGEILTIDGVEVRDSKLTQARIADILAELNKKYASRNVIFVTEKPENVEYSTIFIGKTEAFDRYGSFAGVAETIDHGNQIKNDNAFVNLDSTATDEQIISTISHETCHLLGILDHGGDELARYACSSYNNTYTGSIGTNERLSLGLHDKSFVDCSNSTCTTTYYYYSTMSGGSIAGSVDVFGSGASVVDCTVWQNGSLICRTGGYLSDIDNYGIITLFGDYTAVRNVTLHSGAGIADAAYYIVRQVGSSTGFIEYLDEDYVVSGNIRDLNFVGYGGLHARNANVSNTTVADDGMMILSAGTIASDTVVKGYFHISAGASAVNAAVDGGGLKIYDGGTLKNLTISNGGVASATAGASLLDTISVVSGKLILYGTTIDNPVISSGAAVNGTSNAVINNAEVRGVIGNDAGAHTTSDAVIYNGGSQVVNYLSEAYGTTVSTGGSMFLYGLGSNTVVDNGYLYEYDNDAFDYDTILRGSAVQHLEYASAVRTQVSSGAVQSAGYGADTVSAVISSGGSQMVHGANNYYAYTYDTVVYGVQSAVSNAVLSNTRIYGSQYLGNNASAINNHIINATLTAHSGAYVNRLYISGGKAILDSTVSAVNGEIFSGGLISNGYFANLIIHSGGVLKNGAPTAYHGGVLDVRAGGSATGVALDREDDLHIAVNSQTLLQATDRNGSAYNVSNGQFAGLTVYGGYDVKICSGAAASNNTVQGSGTMTVGGVACNININSGGRLIVSGGSVSGGNNYGVTTVLSGGYTENMMNGNNYAAIHVSDGGVADGTTLVVGDVVVSSGGTAADTFVFGGDMTVSSGGKALNTLVDRGTLTVSSGGTATIAFNPWMGTVSSASGADVSYLERDAKIYIGNYGLLSRTDILDGAVISSGSSAIVYDGGIAKNNTVSGYNAILRVSSGGVAENNLIYEYLNVGSGGIADSNTIYGYGSAYVLSGGILRNTAVAYRARVEVSSGGTLHNAVVSGGFIYLSSGGKLTGSAQLSSDAVVSAYSGSIIELDVSGRACDAGALINNGNRIYGYFYFRVVTDSVQQYGSYDLIDNVSWSGSLSVDDGTGESVQLVIGGNTVTANGLDYTIAKSNNKITFTLDHHTDGDQNGVSWGALTGAENYIVEYSTDNFATVLAVNVEGTVLDTALNAGDFQWRVRQDGELGQWGYGENISAADPGVRQVNSNDDGNADLFFARKNGVWNGDYKAVHQGEKNGWQGTGESAALAGKNVIADVFNGSDDANILVLTDDTNGDALFVEDVYTSFGKDAARLSQINEIRAGSGDDIVDMTGQRFAYDGSEMTIRGGDGDDVIWAAGGDNDLFGDAGNDRITGSTGFDLIIGGDGNDSMISGGGDDIFAFGENWGRDTVEITDDSEITLWFADGSTDNWDSGNLVYSDGVNSVTVSGTDDSRIVLKFGDDASRDYDDMLEIGAFDGASSRKIFEENSSGQLA